MYSRPVPSTSCASAKGMPECPGSGKDRSMKRIAVVALMLHLAVAAAYAADERSSSVRMTASGTMTGPTITLQANTITDDEILAGDGTLGVFTFHGLRADARAPQVPVPPATCGTPLFFP